MSNPDPTRRNFLKLALLTLGSASIPSFSFALTNAPRALQMNNLHTGEILKTQYFDGLHYQAGELQKINHLCRDFRQNEATAMDKHLFDQLSKIQQIIGCNKQIQIISGYRSPETNNMLRKNSTGVAKKSLHMRGKAIDFRIDGIPLAKIRKAALSLKAGGVGYYPGSNFIHIDTGRFRTWVG
jgi:uncharacterized protein YcbK (DUF882 family)